MLILGAETESSLKVIYASGVDQTTANRLHLTSTDLKRENHFLSFDHSPQLVPFFSRRIVDLYDGLHILELYNEDPSFSIFYFFLVNEKTQESPWETLKETELQKQLLKSLHPLLSTTESAKTSLEKRLEEKIKTGSSLMYRIDLAQKTSQEPLFYINTIIQAERIRRLFDKITGERVSAYSLNDHVFLLLYPEFLRIDPNLLEHQLKTALSQTLNMNMDWDNLHIEVKKLEVLDEKLLAFLDGDNSEP